MKKLRFFDSLKFVLATVACTFILNVAHADTSINSVIAYGKTEQSGTPTPTAPVPIMTNNGVLKVNPNLFNQNDVINGYTNGSTGTNVVAHGSTKTFVISCKPGTKYTFYFDNSIVSNGRCYIAGFNEKPEIGSVNIQGVYASNESKIHRVTFTTGANVHYLALWLVYSFADSNMQNALKTVKLMEGTSADEIYVDGLTETIRDSAGHTATAQMLLGINDTYRDEQNITTGAITRKVGVKVLNGTGTWASSSTYGATVYLQSAASNEFSPAAAKEKIISNYFVGEGVASTSSTHPENTCFFNTTGHLYFRTSKTPAEFKQWLADQYAAGTPVIVVYPLATETTESVATQTLTTAPVRQTAGSILGMPIEVVLGDGTREWVSEIITIATTKYNEESFAPVKTDLSAAVNAVEYVVSNTMSQAQAIDQIANEKQTRPDESCPPFKKCLLVEDEQGVPHWYEIYDPINDFLRPILAAAALSGNQGAPVMTTHTSGSDTIYDTFNGFYNGSGAFRKKYIDGVASATDRPFGPTTLPRCADNATRTTSTVDAGICYNTGGMFRTLTEGADDDAGEWALVWKGNGAEGGASLGITPGVVYGIAKCTTVGQHATEMTGDVADGSNYWWPKKLNSYSTTLASLITEYPNSNVETVFNTLPNPYGTTDSVEYPRANYRNCWCKMTAIGVPGAGDDFTEQAANGTIMSVSGGWVFDTPRTSAANCVNNCANVCASRVRGDAAFRQSVLTVK